MDWSEKLPRPIKVRNGTVLKTREDAANYILGLPSHWQHRQRWIVAAKALQAGAPIDRVHELMIKALSSSGDLASRRNAGEAR